MEFWQRVLARIDEEHTTQAWVASKEERPELAGLSPVQQYALVEMIEAWWEKQ
ncbi:MAG TPA: hypothetical protein PLI66_06660 [Spirochaetales bacterium]|nr:hypothetical protein [Spirochaetales bacterium]